MTGGRKQSTEFNNHPGCLNWGGSIYFLCLKLHFLFNFMAKWTAPASQPPPPLSRLPLTHPLLPSLTPPSWVPPHCRPWKTLQTTSDHLRGQSFSHEYPMCRWLTYCALSPLIGLLLLIHFPVLFYLSTNVRVVKLFHEHVNAANTSLFMTHWATILQDIFLLPL